MTDRILSEKVGLITGAATGIGETSASVFFKHGAKLLLADVQQEKGEAVAAEIRAAGGDAVFVKTDVTNADEVEAMVATAVKRWGRLDFALNNAGIDGEMGPLIESSHENFRRVIAVNLEGVYSCMKFEIVQMLEQGGGAIVNVASIAGLVGVAGLSAYCAAKHGIVGLTRSAALEYAKAGVRINVICPGGIRTAMIDSVIEQGLLDEEQLVALHPVGRIGKTEEVAEAAAWMCSDKASFIHGHAMTVDGGLVAG